MVSTPTGASQVPMRPIEETPSECLSIFGESQPIDQSRLRRLTGQPLLENFLSGAIPSRHPHRRIMSQAVEVILV
jgi:hypothetical protein